MWDINFAFTFPWPVSPLPSGCQCEGKKSSPCPCPLLTPHPLSYYKSFTLSKLLDTKGTDRD